MKPASPPIKPWRMERARLLLSCCEQIAADRLTDMPAARAIKKACRKFNSSALARRRGLHCCQSGMRAHYSKFQAAPILSTFEPLYPKSRAKKIGAEFANELARRAIIAQVPVDSLYAKLAAETPGIQFSKATLHRALAGKARPIHAVWRARRHLEKTILVALGTLVPKGEA